MPVTSDPSAWTGPMTAVELAEADGQAMGRALAGRPDAERAAWWRGVRSVLETPSSYRGLPEPPAGWGWAEDAGHALRGSHGLAHLITKPSGGMRHAPSPITALCGMTTAAWVMVGRWESEQREACPGCAGQRVIS